MKTENIWAFAFYRVTRYYLCATLRIYWRFPYYVQQFSDKNVSFKYLANICWVTHLDSPFYLAPGITIALLQPIL